MLTPQKAHGPLRSYGRIKSRPIKARQAALFETLLPTITVPCEPFTPLALMPEASDAWLEIGFGGGEHLAGQAAREPQTVFIGAEPFQNGVASALRHIDEAGLSNVRIHAGDARDLLGWMPDASIGRVFIMFPDPWPKGRHHKRRLVQTETVAELARVLKPEGSLRFATDWAEYADWALERFQASPHFEWTASDLEACRTPPEDHLTTRYEEKKLGDCVPVFLDFRRP